MKREATMVALVILGFGFTGCKTKSELRREQEFERIKQDVRDARGTKADLETVAEELKTELTRLTSLVEEQGVQLRGQNEELRKEIAGVTLRLQTLEQRAVAEDAAAKHDAEERAERSRPTYDNAKRLYDEGAYDDSIDVLHALIKAHPKGDDAKRAQFLLADCYYAAKDYATAALEYGEYRKSFPKDNMVPNATYRMALSFKNLGKTKEAKLFYQELIDKYPKNALVSKARSEMKKLKNTGG